MSVRDVCCDRRFIALAPTDADAIAGRRPLLSASRNAQHKSRHPGHARSARAGMTKIQHGAGFNRTEVGAGRQRCGQAGR